MEVLLLVEWSHPSLKVCGSSPISDIDERFSTTCNIDMMPRWR